MLLREKRLMLICNWLVCAGLIGCGGGGDSSSDRPSNVQSSRASAGSGAWYLGRWVSECGSRIVSGTTVRAITNTFYITSSSSNTATGQLFVATYNDPVSCTMGQPVVVSYNVTLSIDATPVAASGIVTGQADRVTITSPAAAPQVVYVAFSAALDRFWLADQPSYANSTPSYIKSNL